MQLLLVLHVRYLMVSYFFILTLSIIKKIANKIVLILQCDSEFDRFVEGKPIYIHIYISIFKYSKYYIKVIYLQFLLFIIMVVHTYKFEIIIIKKNELL